jgi:GAF domain-containing protein
VTAPTTIDRLSLDVPGADAAAGQRVGKLVAELLAPLVQPGIDAESLGRVQVELTAQPGESVETLARRIASAIARALARAERLEAGR